jgi:hypothetical protein
MGFDSGGKSAAGPLGARPIFVVLLAVVVFGAAAFGGVTFVKKRAASRRVAADAAAAGRARRTQSVGIIALAPLPVKSPLVERPGLDDFGYPRSYVDQAALRSLLGRARYAELSAYVQGFQRQFEADSHAEYFVRGVSDAFDSAEPELEPLLDAWIEASPASFAPYLARGSQPVVAMSRHSAPCRRSGHGCYRRRSSDACSSSTSISRSSSPSRARRSTRARCRR